MRLRFRFGAIAVVAALAAFLAAGPAMAGTCGQVRGNEYVGGAVYGRAALAQGATISLALGGLVRTHSSFALPGSNARTATIRPPRGRLHVRLTGKRSTGRAGTDDH